ncbi:MAG: hypothetical protein U0841_04995 [Chloroflexia bacterium]
METTQQRASEIGAPGPWKVLEGRNQAIIERIRAGKGGKNKLLALILR